MLIKPYDLASVLFDMYKIVRANWRKGGVCFSSVRVYFKLIHYLIK